MLAQRFSRLHESPIRYAAMDPAHLQAIENYLRINTRAHGLPQLHQQAQGVLGPIYQQHPIISPHFGGILQGHGDALMKYLDLMQDRANMGDPQKTDLPGLNDPQGQHPLSFLLGHLHNLNANIGSGQAPAVGGDGLLSLFPIHTMYSQAALEHPSTRDMLRQAYMFNQPGQGVGQYDPTGLAFMRLQNSLHTADAPQGIINELADHAGRARGGDVGGHLGILHTLESRPEHAASPEPALRSRILQTHIGRLFRENLIPHLAENFG
jgi:hypothetical protein